MKTITTIIVLTILSFHLTAQKNDIEQAIVDEGMAMYQSEMASWYGTDLFREKLPQKMEQIGGYFSYPNENGGATCVFINQAKPPQAYVVFTFDDTFDETTAKIDTTVRDLTTIEYDLYAMRLATVERTRKDKIFEYYENTRYNIIPLIRNGEKKVFILTAPEKTGVVLFGNDYEITFNAKNKIKKVRKIHQNLIAIDYTQKLDDENAKQVSGIHSHLPETGDYMTSTDICTLLLYSKYTDWERHTVISKKFMCVWSCESQKLAVIPMDAIEKMEEEGEEKKAPKKRKSKRKN